MTASKLLQTLRFLDELDSQLGLQRSLDAVVEAMNNLVSQPAHPHFQSVLANALEAFSAGAEKLPSAITPAQMAIIRDMGGEEFFDATIDNRIRTAIEKNAMTPAVARDLTRDFATRRTTFMETVSNTRHGLQRLNVSQPQLDAGTVDLSFLVPRDIFKNHLDAFAKELSFISRLVQHINEGATGSADPVILTTLSSSIPTIGLETGLKAIELLATIVVKFLEAWEKVGKMRRIRSEMTDMAISGPPVDHLTKQITTTIEEVVEECTEMVLIDYPGSADRRNELNNALSRDTRRLFGQIERGLTFDFRANPPSEGGEDGHRRSLDRISQLSRDMTFPEPTREPILLESGQVVEDYPLVPDERTVIRRSTKRTTTKHQITETSSADNVKN